MKESSLKAKTAKGLFWGGVGNGLQQLFNLFFGIFLARLLDASDYGMIGMLAIFSAISSVIQEGGFGAALINKEKITQEDCNAVFWFSLSAGFCLYILLFLSAPFIAGFYGIPELAPLSRFMFLGFLIGCTGTVHGAIFTKRLMIKEKIHINLIALFCSGCIGLAMAYCGMAYWAIATQQVSYMLLMVSMLWYKSPWKPTLQFSAAPLKEMLPFSIKIAFTNIFNQINQNILTVLMGKYYTSRQVGYYTQGNKWMMMGSSLVTSMVTNVAQPVLIQVSSEVERQKNVFRKMLRFVSFISFPAMLGLALIAPELITITITDKWQASVRILQLLCVWGAVIPINSLYSNMIISRGQSQVYMWNTVALGILQILALIFMSRYGIFAMLATFTTINVMWLGIWNASARKSIGLQYSEMLKDLLPFLMAAIATTTVTYVLTQNIANPYMSLACKTALAVLLYATIMWAGKSVIFKESIRYILKRESK